MISSYYTWNDVIYREYMVEMLCYLEPIYFEKGSMIINELDEFGEIIFVQKGIV